MRKDYVKRGEIIIGMDGAVCCSNSKCPHISCIGCCTDINAKCEYEKQRADALLHYMIDDDKATEIQLRKK